jgi:16S rRNA (uracil1498-N3)-methyltransferase
MNLILFSSEDLVSPHSVRLTGRRFQHIIDILKPAVGDTLSVGVQGGLMGAGIVRTLSAENIILDVALSDPPPVKLPVILCVALMRPIVLKRVLLTAASLGVEEIILFHSSKVEKSFWQSTSLGDEELRDQLILGLEQAKDTVLPKVSFQKRFKPFVEDILPELLKTRRGIVADPSGEVVVPSVAQATVLIIGPEAGVTPYEVEKFKEAGCQVIGLGQRILKVETAIVTLLAKLF